MSIFHRKPKKLTEEEERRVRYKLQDTIDAGNLKIQELTEQLQEIGKKYRAAERKMGKERAVRLYGQQMQMVALSRQAIQTSVATYENLLLRSSISATLREFTEGLRGEVKDFERLLRTIDITNSNNEWREVMDQIKGNNDFDNQLRRISNPKAPGGVSINPHDIELILREVEGEAEDREYDEGIGDADFILDR